MKTLHLATKIWFPLDNQDNNQGGISGYLEKSFTHRFIMLNIMSLVLPYCDFFRGRPGFQLLGCSDVRGQHIDI